VALTPSLAPGALEAIEAFIHDHVEDSGARGVVAGLSGGIDSALVATLAARAVGPSRVTCLYLPIEAVNDRDALDARAAAARLKIKLISRDLSRAYQTMAEELDARGRRARGNLKARLRMVALYAEANRRNALVLGTGNKSELLTGYFTKWGDGGCDLLPIGDLYKTQVRSMARELKLPKAVIEKEPTAGLWPGQTDEGELGITYERLDQILLGLELKMVSKEIARRTKIPLALVEKVRARVEGSSHKRRLPPVCKLGLRTVGIDWREL
jgi:NAD+ synthase